MGTDENHVLGHARAWSRIDGYPGWLVLMDHSQNFNGPRFVVSKTDEHILRESLKALFPNKEVKIIEDGSRRYLVRKA